MVKKVKGAGFKDMIINNANKVISLGKKTSGAAPAAPAAQEAATTEAPGAAPAPDSKGGEKETSSLPSMAERSVDGFSWLYVFVLSAAALALMFISVNAWADYRKLRNYDPSPDGKRSLVFKDTVEYDLINYDNFSIFTEGRGTLTVGLSAGVNFMLVVILHLILIIVFAFKKELKGLGDVKGAFVQDGKPSIFTYMFGVVIVYYGALLGYKFGFYDKVFKEQLINGTLKTARNNLQQLEVFINSQIIYNGNSAPTFYGLLGDAHLDNASALSNLIVNTSKRNANDAVKMIATFNLYNYYLGYFNSVADFWASDVAQAFSNASQIYSDFKFSNYVPVLFNQNGGVQNVVNMISQSQEMTVEWVSKLSNSTGITSDVSLRMRRLNGYMTAAFGDMNWTRKDGRKSKVYTDFDDFFTKRMYYTVVWTAPLWLGIIYVVMLAFKTGRDKLKNVKPAADEGKDVKPDAKAEASEPGFFKKLFKKNPKPVGAEAGADGTAPADKPGFLSGMRDRFKGLMNKNPADKYAVKGGNRRGRKRAALM